MTSWLVISLMRTKIRKLGSLSDLLLKHIVKKIISILIPLNDIRNKIIWKFSPDRKLSVKIATWTNNDKITPHPRAKLLNHIQKLNLIPKIKLFAGKLIRGKLPTRGGLRNIRIDTNGNCSFCHNRVENIYYVFKDRCFIQKIWNIFIEYCRTPIKSNLHFIDWIEYIWEYEKVYIKNFGKPLEKILVIAWAIWTQPKQYQFQKRDRPAGSDCKSSG